MLEGLAAERTASACVVPEAGVRNRRGCRCRCPPSSRRHDEDPRPASAPSHRASALSNTPSRTLRARLLWLWRTPNAAQCTQPLIVQNGAAAPGHIQSIVSTIAPTAESVQKNAGDPYYNAECANAERVAHRLTSMAPIINEAVSSNKARVVPAIHDLRSGRVKILLATMPLLLLY